MKQIYLIFICLLFTQIVMAEEERKVYELNIKNHKFSPATLYVKANVKIKLIIHNDDDTVEEFESTDLRREKIVAPHSSVNILVGPLEPGVYSFFGDFNQETAQGKIIVD